MDQTYPLIRSLSVSPVGRTNIDLSWAEPFTGTLYAYADFDYLVIPSGWLDRTSRTLTGESCWTNDPENWIFVANKDDLSGWYYQNRIDYGILLMSTAATETLWLLSPDITFKDDSYISWWNRFRYSDDEGNLVTKRPYFEVVSYSGAFDEVNRENNIVYTKHAVYDGSVSPENIWEYKETVSLASLGGTTARVGFRVPVNSNDQYTLAFDKITIGAETSDTIEQCTGYEIYRNGTKVADFVSTGSEIENWPDLFFVDGVNEYYIKATYPTGVSLPCERVSVTVDKNPKPDYLTVDYQEWLGAELNWYMPYHNPPKWYSYIAPEKCNSVTYLSDIEMPKRRTLFKAEDLGFYYPVTIDSIAAVFYDINEGNWGGNNTFKFRILTGGEGSFDNVIYESPICTAVHCKITKHMLTTPIVLDEPFNVEVECLSGTSDPTILMGLSGGATHSYFLYDPGSGDSYYYGLIDGDTDLFYDWCHMAFVTSSMPEPLAKNSGWVRSVSDIDKAVAYTADNPVRIKETVKSPVPLDYYKIYRNGVSIGTTTSLNYFDASVPMGLSYLAYKVTAVYTNPAGESDPSNEVVVFGTGIENNEIIPHKAELFQNYPNPFNPVTTIRYSLPAEADVRLSVYDITGREVAELVSGRQAKGSYSVSFNAEGLTSGSYLYRLDVDGKSIQSRKMIMLK